MRKITKTPTNNNYVNLTTTPAVPTSTSTVETVWISHANNNCIMYTAQAPMTTNVVSTTTPSITATENCKPVATSSNTTNTKKNNGINGKIDEIVQQGATGDCWLIAGVLALNSSPTGKRIIKESIHPNTDGSVTVYFKGLNQSYTISVEELIKYDTDNNIDDEYSNGDNDMLVLELATQKLMKDLSEGKITIDKTDAGILGSRYNKEGKIEGGMAERIIYYLTGEKSGSYVKLNNTQLDEKTIIRALTQSYECGNSILTFGLGCAEGHKAKLIDGTNYKYDDGPHALAITELTATTITFVNPWDSETKYTMTWQKFIKLGPINISVTDLTKIATKEENAIYENRPQIPEPEKTTYIMTETYQARDILSLGLSFDQIDEYFGSLGNHSVQGINMKKYTLKDNIKIPNYDGEIKTLQDLAKALDLITRKNLKNQGLNDEFIDRFFEIKKIGTGENAEYKLVLKEPFTSYKILNNSNGNIMVELKTTDGKTTTFVIKNDGEIINISNINNNDSDISFTF